jgi:putative membrane protein
MKRIFYAVVAVIFVIFGITFAFQNKQIVEVNYYFGLHWSGPMSVVLLSAVSLGIVIGFLASLRTVVRLQRSLGQARREIRLIEQEVINLRALPIKDVL